MTELRLPLKKKWFNMHQSGEKPEDYREITPYWCSRLLLYNGKHKDRGFWERCYLHMFSREILKKFFECETIHGITAKKFDFNVMTLGYPKSTDNDRVLKYEHKGIEIGHGKPEWGAEPDKLYFVIKHGKRI
jgi:hypothetical protein